MSIFRLIPSILLRGLLNVYSFDELYAADFGLEKLSRSSEERFS